MQIETQLLEVIQLANVWNVVHKIIDVILIIKINQWSVVAQKKLVGVDEQAIGLFTGRVYINFPLP